MTADHLGDADTMRVPASPPPSTAGATPSAEERLERGEILCYERCPFALPEGDDRRFLMEQQLRPWGHKNISYDPHTGRLAGFVRRSAEQAARLRHLLATFSEAATAWLAGELPRYARGCHPDRASLRPEEEATRRLRLTARNDLLHIDAFPTRPSHGRRILRLFVNLNPSEPRVWAISEPFDRLLARYGPQVGLPAPDDPPGRLGRSLRRLFRFPRRRLRHPGPGHRSAYDQFMLRFHHFLKTNDDFQERGPKRFQAFPPGSAWLAFTDGIAYAEVRGRYALEHSYFITPPSLVLPAESPAALLARFCGWSALNEAA
ncbi:MAG TPA: Kdo hydroxylase family protein [Gemmataceae bacterium]|nr:Kdo hydroxylase family protein [Gemmataceae bacterium]